MEVLQNVIFIDQLKTYKGWEIKISNFYFIIFPDKTIPPYRQTIYIQYLQYLFTLGKLVLLSFVLVRPCQYEILSN